MKKKLVWLAVSATLIAAVLAVALCGCSGSEKAYRDKVAAMEIFDNEIENAYSQKVVSDAVEKFYEGGRLTADGKVKKVLFMGYDGCRAELLSLIKPDAPSAIRTVSEEMGGGVWHAFSGGIEGDKATKQATSTGPSWASIFTGVFGCDNGVVDNGQIKNADYLNFTTRMVKAGYAVGGVFNFSWDEHPHTYQMEAQYARNNGYKSDFWWAYGEKGDEQVHAKMLADVAGDEYDIITCTYEFTDHAGHDTGFTIDNEPYVQGYYDEEKCAQEVIDAVKARATYENEDWMIILTTDHGGNKTWHGQQTQFERLTWIASNKDFATLLA